MGKDERDFDELLEEKIKKANITYEEETSNFDEKIKSLFGSISDNNDIRTSLMENMDEDDEEENAEESENEVKEFFSAAGKKQKESKKDVPVLEKEHLEHEKKGKKRKKKGGSVVGVLAAVCVVVAGVGAGGYYVYNHMGDFIKEKISEKLAIGNEETPEVIQKPEEQQESQVKKEEAVQKEPEKKEEAVQKEPEKKEEAVQKESEKKEEAVQKEPEKKEEAVQKEPEKKEEAVQKEPEKKEEAEQKEPEKKEETEQKEPEKKEETEQKESEKKEETEQKKPEENNTEEDLVSVKKVDKEAEEKNTFVEATQSYKDIYNNTVEFGVVDETSDISLAEALDQIEAAETVEIPANVVVAVTERQTSGDDTWSRVNYLGMTGWMKDEDLDVIIPENDKAAMTEKVYVNIPLDGTVDLRKENNADSDSMSEFSYGKEAVLLGSNGQWVKVQADGKVGWLPITAVSIYVPGYYYVNTEDQDAITVRSGAGVENESVGSLGYGEKVKITQFKDGWGKISEDEEKWVILQFMAPCDGEAVQEEAATAENNQVSEEYYDPNYYYEYYNYDQGTTGDQGNTEQPSDDSGTTDDGGSDVPDDNTDWVEDVPSIDIPVPDDMGEPDTLPE